MAYLEEMVSIGKVENGWIVSVRVPYRDDGDEGQIMPMHEREKNFYVKSVEDIGPKLATLLPALTDKMSAEEEFDKAFKEFSDE